ncbi:hypothetical protein DID75_01830 [Candidatus Marinamargulisbacteria bacterium SCGC AG-410-N11]|nr:hypothetical protein DID75_01830 [Candidatus Marinamargulisbacteria bacterium SCGC AG-410-N11]
MNKKTNAKRLKKSKDLLTNTTKSNRQAIALKYDVDKDKAPKIIATGKGYIADMILQVAEENQVPFYEDENLTQLLSKLDINDEIPGDLYTLVAEVLAFVFQLDKLAKKRKKLKAKYEKGKK